MKLRLNPREGSPLQRRLIGAAGLALAAVPLAACASGGTNAVALPGESNAALTPATAKAWTEAYTACGTAGAAPTQYKSPALADWFDKKAGIQECQARAATSISVGREGTDLQVLQNTHDALSNSADTSRYQANTSAQPPSND